MNIVTAKVEECLPFLLHKMKATKPERIQKRYTTEE
jgi:hypothetical protein